MKITHIKNYIRRMLCYISVMLADLFILMILFMTLMKRILELIV